MEKTKPQPSLTQRSDRVLRRAASTVLVVVGSASAVQSYAHLTALAGNSGISSHMAWLYPVSVDGLLIAGTIALLHATLAGTARIYPWLLLVTGSLLSLWGNLASDNQTVSAAIVHGVPALVLVAVTEAVMMLLRNRLVKTAAVHAEQERAEAKVARAEQRREEVDQRAVRLAQRQGLSARAAAYRSVVPAGASLTQQAVAVLNLHQERFGGRVPAADVAQALGVSVPQARKSIERARVSMKQQEQQSPPVLVAAV